MLFAAVYLAVTANALLTEYVELPSSCLGQEDGYTWCKLRGPPRAQNEYMVVDVSCDPNVNSIFCEPAVFETFYRALFQTRGGIEAAGRESTPSGLEQCEIGRRELPARRKLLSMWRSRNLDF